MRLRRINIAWLSITRTDILPNELVFNAADGSLVFRNAEAEIRRYDSAASRAI